MEQDFEFVKKCIDSCLTEWQIACAGQLINLFIAKYNASAMSNELMDFWVAKDSMIMVSEF